MKNIIANEVHDIFEEISNILLGANYKTFFITGATGLIGKYLIFTLAGMKREGKFNGDIIAHVRNEAKAKKIFDIELKEGLIKLNIQDIKEPINYSGNVDYIIHGASITDSAEFVQKPVDTIDTLILGTKNVLDFAKSKNIDSMVLLSSLEVYGVPSGLETVSENQFGAIDPVNIRSSYSEGKRISETMASAYHHQYRVPIKIARLCQTFGPGVDLFDNRVFAQFARAVIKNEDIILKTKGDTVRNYCYLNDAITAIFTILVNGTDGEPYNVANDQTSISIKELAELTISLRDTETKLVYDIVEDPTKLGYNPKVIINLNTDRLKKLGWRAKVGINEMMEKLLDSMEREMKNS